MRMRVRRRMNCRVKPRPRFVEENDVDGMVGIDSRSMIQDNGEGPSSPAKLAKLQQTVERRQKKQKRKAEEGKLQVKRQEMDKAKVSLSYAFSRSFLITSRFRTL